MPLNWTFTFAANDLPSAYIPSLNLLRTNAQAVDAEVVSARGGSADLAGALSGKAGIAHQHSAADVTSGTLSPARVGTGTPNAGVWLRGDGAWAVLPNAVVAWGAVTGTLSMQIDLQGALDSKAPSVHTHAITALTQSGATAGQVLAWDNALAQWVPISPGSAGAVGWGSVVGTLADQLDLKAALDGKAPTAHTHAPTDITGFGVAGGYLRSSGTAWVRNPGVGWNDLTGVPTTFAPAAHSHDASAIVSGTLSTARIPALPVSQITSGVFSTERLASGAASSSVWLRGDGTWSSLPSSAAPTWGSITGLLSAQIDLQAALNSKASQDHVGAGGTAHAAATTLADGFMSAAQVTKLNGIATGATANSTDAVLLARSNHTGSQAQSTVTNLVTDLAAKATLAANTFSGVQTATDFTSSSDARIKSHIVDMDVALGYLRPVRYFHDETRKIEIGFIAQEVRELYPEAVHQRDDGMLTLAYPRLTAALAAELRELRQVVASQALVIRDFEQRLLALEAR